MPTRTPAGKYTPVNLIDNQPHWGSCSRPADFRKEKPSGAKRRLHEQR
jgi:hypothetical protein